MAERKYDTVLIKTTGGEGQIRNHPWYKERLQTKYLQQDGKRVSSQFLITKDWVFVKDGQDDFRDGLPPLVDEKGLIIKQDKELGPTLTGAGAPKRKVQERLTRSTLSKDEVCFAKALPKQQRQRDYIKEVEFGVLQHPLALYPHLEESLMPEVFEDVVNLVDPEMNLVEEESTLGSSRPITTTNVTGATGSRRNTLGSQGASSSATGRDVNTPSHEISWPSMRDLRMLHSAPPALESVIPNPYYWLPKKEDEERQQRKNQQETRAQSPSGDARIQHVTREFCEWVSGLGGDGNNIEESTVTSLFASGYETKPPLSVPIHVVELTSVPPELRGNVQMPASAKGSSMSPEEQVSARKSKPWGHHPGPHSVEDYHKFRYGAWYLPKKHWNKLDAEQPLQDPKVLDKEKQNEVKQRSDQLNESLAPMHGARSFISFMNQKGTRKPKFLEEIITIQQKAEEEERQRKEAEKNRRKGGGMSTSDANNADEKQQQQENTPVD